MDRATSGDTRDYAAIALLALWNALPGVEKRRKLGDRDATGLGLDRSYSAHPMRATFITAAVLDRRERLACSRCGRQVRKGILF